MGAGISALKAEWVFFEPDSCGTKASSPTAVMNLASLGVVVFADS